MIHILGWQFGLIESICVIVLVGIAFDYVSHFAHLFMISPFETKKERVEYAYQHMGQTILGGALTSNLAGVFMMICQVNILNKFGILFLTTITTAFVTSIVFLPALLYVMGPDKD